MFCLTTFYVMLPSTSLSQTIRQPILTLPDPSTWFPPLSTHFLTKLPLFQERNYGKPNLLVWSASSCLCCTPWRAAPSRTEWTCPPAFWTPWQCCSHSAIWSIVSLETWSPCLICFFLLVSTSILDRVNLSPCLLNTLTMLLYQFCNKQKYYNCVCFDLSKTA